MTFDEIEPYCEIFLYMNKYNHDEEPIFAEQNECMIYDIIFQKIHQNEENLDRITNFFKKNNVTFILHFNLIHFILEEHKNYEKYIL